MKCVVVTGASRGIGRYLCDNLADEFDVVGLARSLPDGFKHRFIQADVTDPEQLSTNIRELKLGRVYGLVNCAGVAAMNLFMTTPPATIRRVLETNTLGTMNSCTAVLPMMVRNREGRIINFSSLSVNLGLEGESIYVASKAAVEAFSRVLAKEVATYGITVNTVSPNPIDTDLLAGVDERKIQKIVSEDQAVKRMGELGDVLNVVLFYLNQRSALVTGQNVVLGGY